MESLRDWERHVLEAEEYLDAGDRDVVFWHEAGRGKSSGAEVETPTPVIYMDRAAALEAVGLRE